MSNLIKGLAAAGLMTCSGMASALSFSDKYEGYTFSDTAVLEPVYYFFNDVNPAGACAQDYTYGGFPGNAGAQGAPNFTDPGDFPRISALTNTEAGTNQGVQGLSIFPDFNNADLTAGCQIDQAVFVEQDVTVADEGQTWVLRFDYKQQSGGVPGTAAVFIKHFDPSFALIGSSSVDISAEPASMGWEEGIEISLAIPAGAAANGDIVQIGFQNVTTGNVPATTFYDNVCLFPAGNDSICSTDSSSGAPTGGLTSFSDNFDGYGAGPFMNELANAGYGFANNVFEAGTGNYLFTYTDEGNGTPSAGPQISAIAPGEGLSGDNALNIYSDYDCCVPDPITNPDLGHSAGGLVEVNVIQEQTPGAADVGTTWQFAFDAKGGLILNELSEPSSTSSAGAFIKVLDPDAGFSVIDSSTVDLTTTPGVWTGYSLTLNITAGMVGKLLQFGFTNTSTDFDETGVFYDNLDFNPLTGCVGNGTDTDGDGVDDNCDNCEAVANAGQEDADSDGFGNICDGDFNNDCAVNGLDLGIFKGAFFSMDPLTDMNSDGAVNGLDLGLFKSAFFGSPGPNGADITDACP